MVSVLESVADAYATKPLPLKRFGMEAEVGIERVPPSTSHSQSTVCIITDALKIKGGIRYVKDNLDWLSITPFYSPPMSPAGISAGTFLGELCFRRLIGVRWLKRQRAKTKAPSDNETR